jgi:hypothetical protein
MADLLTAVETAMSFMGQLTKFVSETKVRYVCAEYKDHKWMVTQKGNHFIMTRDGKYTTVCCDDTNPIVATLSLIREGNMDPPRNKEALNLEYLVKVSTQI